MSKRFTICVHKRAYILTDSINGYKLNAFYNKSMRAKRRAKTIVGLLQFEFLFKCKKNIFKEIRANLMVGHHSRYTRIMRKFV